MTDECFLVILLESVARYEYDEETDTWSPS